MSWDIVMFRAEQTQDSSLNPDRMLLLSKELVVHAIKTFFPETDISDENWMVFDSASYSVVFSTKAEKHIDLYVDLWIEEHETELIGRLKNLSNALGCELFDLSTLEFII